ncbi:MAG: nucleotidyl transferase AbiEii/AbiGii toxin family protein [Solirubrobacteraceae bacterium]
MRYATAAAFRQALDDRLKTEAARTGLPLARLRKQVAFELFLCRLVTVAPNRWVLKGALALELRLKATTRPTKDIDLGRDDDEQAAIEDITAAQQLVLDDFFTYNAIRTDEFDRTDEFAAVRLHVTAQLAGRTFEQFTVDIGFTDSIPDTPDTIKTSDLLAFADIDPIELPVLPLAQHLAEKVHAYTCSYGTAGRPSTRPKDLVDILLISGSEPIDARALRNALEATFAERQRQELPSSLPAPPADWAAPYGRLAADVGVEPELGAAFANAARFLDPILAGRSEGSWDAERKRWS